MRKFNPVQFNRQRWGDRFHTKNHPKQCATDHQFCHLDYEWANDDEAASAPLNEDLLGLALPPAAEPCTVSYQMMTEENLDDWIAQSLNRSLASMVNPQKKFFLPTPYEEEIKARYRKRISSKKYEDETYFKREPRMRKAVSYLSAGDSKPKNTVADLYFDYRQLQAKTLAGTPIRAREVQHKPKEEVRRRNAVLLANDIHYARFLKELARVKERPPSEPPASDPLPISTPQRQMIYSFNIDSMRRTGCHDNVPNSIIEREFERIRQPQKDFMVANRNHFKKQEEIQEQTREAINEKAANAVARIDALVRKDPPQPSETNAFRVSNISKKASVGVGRVRQAVVGGSGVGGGERRLQQKVMRLLNNMQVISQHIDVEMSKLDIHLPVVHLRHPNSKIQNKWVLKAEEKLREGENVLAIDCYKQALILQPEFFIPIYNIAVLLEREKMLSYAKSWFQLAKEFQTDTENVSFGLALVQIKQLQFGAGLREIDEIIQTLEGQKKKVDMTYYYIRALCYKQLGQFENARKDYEIIIRHSKPSNYHSLSYFLLSVVFAKSRRYTPKFNCLSFMNWRETLHLLFYQRGRRVKEEGIDLAERLCKQPFFCRFSKNLVKKLLTVAEYESIRKDSILFIGEAESVIIISGLVSIWSHQQSITSPDTVSVLGQGGVLGGGTVDNHLSARPNYWFLAKTELEVLRVSRAEFQLFWQGQITFEWDYKYNFLRNVGLFRGLPEATLFRLCEVLELRTYQRNDILFNDCSYRNQLLSREGLGFCLGRSSAPDPRFVNAKKGAKGQDNFGNRRKARSRLAMLLRKHTFRFNEMKFNRLRYPGLFILVEGKVEVEDDRGFRCKDIMSPRDYFGENLLIASEGFHNYGRMVVDSEKASFYLLQVEKLMWSFTSLDKEAMLANAKNRKEIETLRFLRNRFSECLEVKMSKLMSKKE